MPELPTGTVTFLLTDIEGSTRLWEQYPDAMRAALARHDALAAAILAQHRGLLVKSRGEGDSLFVVFDRATDAVAAACDLQRAFVAEPWPAGIALRVRMALHTGELDHHEGDYYGAAVNRCARLRAIAHGGQVVLSKTTHALAQEALPEGVSLRRLGSHRLQDLRRPEYVFQLLHPNLPADFPPLRSRGVTLDSLFFRSVFFIDRQSRPILLGGILAALVLGLSFKAFTQPQGIIGSLLGLLLGLGLDSYGRSRCFPGIILLVLAGIGASLFHAPLGILVGLLVGYGLRVILTQKERRRYLERQEKIPRPLRRPLREPVREEVAAVQEPAEKPRLAGEDLAEELLVQVRSEPQRGEEEE